MLATNNLHIYLEAQKVLGSSIEAQEPLPEIVYWKQFLQTNERYFVGWLELTRLYLNDGNIQEAQATLIRAEEINPNSKEVQELKALLF
jgi:tetratricopeptide (TPR) repeat protein